MVCGILALISAPLALFGLLVSAALSIYAVYRYCARTETEWPPERPPPLTSRMARENTTRNPSRTAVTSSSLMIGVAWSSSWPCSSTGSRTRSGRAGQLDHERPDHPVGQLLADTGGGRAGRTGGARRGRPPPASSSPTPRSTTAGSTRSTASIRRHHPGLQARLAEGRVGRAAGALPGRRSADRGEFAKSHHLTIGQHFQVTSIEGNKLEPEGGGPVQGPGADDRHLDPDLDLRHLDDQQRPRRAARQVQARRATSTRARPRCPRR